jgi:hypothetical protein
MIIVIGFILTLFATITRSQLATNYMNYSSCSRDYSSCDDTKGVCVISTAHKVGLCVPACSQAAYTNCYTKQKLNVGYSIAISECEGTKCKPVPDAVAVEDDCTPGQLCDVNPDDPNDFGECTVTLIQGKVCGGASCNPGKPCWHNSKLRGMCVAVTPNLLSCEVQCSKLGDRCTGFTPGGSRFFSGTCDANNTCVDQCPENTDNGAPCYVRIDSTSKDGTCDSTNGYCAPPKCSQAGAACFDSIFRANGTCGEIGNGQMRCVTPAATLAGRQGGSCWFLEANFTAVEGWVTSNGGVRVCTRTPECTCIGGSCVNGSCDAAMPAPVTTTTWGTLPKTTSTARTTSVQSSTSCSSISAEMSSALIVAFATTLFR